VTLALTVVAACVALLLGATPAFAGGSWNGSGPGNSAGPGGGNVNSGGGDGFDCGYNISSKLQGNALYHNSGGKWKLWDYADYPNCSDGGGWVSTSPGFWRCISGFEVYRFYGDAPNAVTRSRLNVPTTCGSSDTVYSFAAQTAWDAHPGTAPGLPDYRRIGTNAMQSDNGLDSDVGVREGNYLTSGQPTRVLGSCTSVSHTNPMQTMWGKMTTEEHVQYRASFGQLYLQASANGRLPLTGANTVGLSSVKGYYYDGSTYQAQLNSGKKKPTQAPDPVNRTTGYFYLSSFAWETEACATPWNFSAVQDSATGKVTTPAAAYGTCVIPLTVAGDKKSRGGSSKWAFPGIDQGYGERYSSYYATDPDSGGTGVAVPAWRNVMYSDYLNRANGSYLNGKGVQDIPLQPFSNEATPNVTYAPSGASLKAAAAALKNDALCFRGTQITTTGGSSTGSTAPTPTGEMQLKADTPSVLQTGGESYRATFTVHSDASQLKCTQKVPCTLTRLNYKVALTSTDPAHYAQCTGGQLSGCSWRVISSTQGGLNRDARITVEFYNATLPQTQLMKFAVSSLSGTYTYQKTVPGYTLTSTNPVTGKKFTWKVAPTKKTVSKNFTPTVKGTPTALSYSGGVYSHTWPVIGAVSTPGD